MKAKDNFRQRLASLWFTDYKIRKYIGKFKEVLIEWNKAEWRDKNKFDNIIYLKIITLKMEERSEWKLPKVLDHSGQTQKYCFTQDNIPY